MHLVAQADLGQAVRHGLHLERLTDAVVVRVDPEGKAQVSTNGGSFPRWRHPQEIVYVGLDRMLMSVPVTGSGTTFRAGVPTPLFTMNAQ